MRGQGYCVIHIRPATPSRLDESKWGTADAFCEAYAITWWDYNPVFPTAEAAEAYRNLVPMETEVILVEFTEDAEGLGPEWFDSFTSGLWFRAVNPPPRHSKKEGV